MSEDTNSPSFSAPFFDVTPWVRRELRAQPLVGERNEPVNSMVETGLEPRTALNVPSSIELRGAPFKSGRCPAPSGAAGPLFHASRPRNPAGAAMPANTIVNGSAAAE